jgi:diguanylate cyclase (GGDEF)-like protein
LTVIFYLLLRLNDQNALVKDRTKRTVTDQLTGAYNRYFIDFIKLKDSTLSSGGTVMYIDGNRVKAVNDKYGHDYGDKAIQLISNAFRTALKKKDYLVRMGGDEFVVILPDQKESDAQILYHNVNRTLQLQSAVELPLLEWTISVTVGYASYSDETNLKAAITEADLQMLSYKEQNTSR